LIGAIYPSPLGGVPGPAFGDSAPAALDCYRITVEEESEAQPPNGEGHVNRVPMLAIVLAVLAGGATFLLVSSGDRAESTTEPTPSLAQMSEPGVVQVWKTPTCGCCGKWIEHLEAAGFDVTVHDVQDLAAVKRELGVPGSLQSCHTALIDGYLLEGHVPAADVRRLLAERPEVAGLAVPGMPVGSPGMEMGDQKDPYDVVTFTSDGPLGIYSEH